MSDSKKNNTPDWEDKLLSEFENLNLKPEDLIRGKTLENIEKKCFDLCKIYMADHRRWVKYANKPEDLEVTRISGGLTNQLYQIKLKNVPNYCASDSITIKFYQSKYLKKYSGVDNPISERLSDTIISIFACVKKIGPKVFGIMPDGIIQSFHEHEQFRIKHQQNDKLLSKLAHKLAEINSWKVPIEKNRFWILEILCDYVHEYFERVDVESLAKELNLPYLLENDLLKETKWLDSFIRQYNSTMVFCHNDFRGSNLMVIKDTEDIVICDFEYSSYGLRGFDIACFLLEWGRDLFDFRDFSLPPDSIIEKFIKFYLEGWDKLKPGYSELSENSVQQIMAETKIGFLMTYFFMIGIVANQRETVFDYMPYDVKMQVQQIHLLVKRFLEIKDVLIKENIIKN